MEPFTGSRRSEVGYVVFSILEIQAVWRWMMLTHVLWLVALASVTVSCKTRSDPLHQDGASVRSAYGEPLVVV